MKRMRRSNDEAESGQDQMGNYGDRLDCGAVCADLAYVENARFVAVGSRTASSAGEFASKYDIPQAYGSYEELVRDPDVDVVYIATPHPPHREHALLSSGRQSRPVRKPLRLTGMNWRN